MTEGVRHPGGWCAHPRICSRSDGQAAQGNYQAVIDGVLLQHVRRRPTLDIVGQVTRQEFTSYSVRVRGPNHAVQRTGCAGR